MPNVLTAGQKSFVLQCFFKDKINLKFLILRNDEPDFLFARAWIPLYFFCGVVTFGSIGRQLAMVSKTSI